MTTAYPNSLSQRVSRRWQRWLAEVPWQAYGLLLPAVSLIAVLFGGGLILAFLQSIGLLGLTASGTLSLDAYREALADSDFWRSLGLSFYLGKRTPG